MHRSSLATGWFAENHPYRNQTVDIDLIAELVLQVLRHCGIGFTAKSTIKEKKKFMFLC